MFRHALRDALDRLRATLKIRRRGVGTTGSSPRSRVEAVPGSADRRIVGLPQPVLNLVQQGRGRACAVVGGFERLGLGSVPTQGSQGQRGKPQQLRAARAWGEEIETHS